MAGSFGGLNTALSGLKYEQVALDVANQNISNVNTDGYVRRRAVAGAVGPSAVPAMWSTDPGHGSGVLTQSVQRLTDDLVEARVRRETGNLANVTAQQTILARVETGINEPGDNGVSAALQGFRSAFQDLVSSPDTPAARETVLAQGNILAAAIHAQAQNITTEQGDDRMHVLDNVTSINNDATQLAQLNDAIRTGQINGTDVGTLLDTRDQVAEDLAGLTGASVTVAADGQYNLAVNGVALVTGKQAGTFTVTGGINPDGSDAGTPLAFAITDPSGTTNVPTTGLGGELGGVSTVLTSTLPGYLSSLNTIAAELVTQVNSVHRAGYGLDGSTGLDFFSATAGSEAATIQVAITDPQKIAASSSAGSFDASNADALSQATTVESDYQSLVTSFGSQVAAINQRATNQQTLTTQVQDAKEQTAGVNLDEETVNMVQAQHAYEASSRVMTVLDSILDTLINHTGVTR